MIYNNIRTNICYPDFQKLETGVWEIGLISDNPGLNDSNSDYYKTVKREKIGENQTSDHRCFKNKVLIKLLDGSQKNAHIIHWCCNGGYFCITNDVFWDNLEDK